MTEKMPSKASSLIASNLITKLPTEILIQIASNLLIKDLNRLALTSSYCNDIVEFVKNHRGPQSLFIKLHQNFTNQNCSCYEPILVTLGYSDANFPQDAYFDRTSLTTLCMDPGPAEEILQELLYCDAKCVILFDTNCAIANSRIGKFKLTVINFILKREPEVCKTKIRLLITFSFKGLFYI